MSPEIEEKSSLSVPILAKNIMICNSRSAILDMTKRSALAQTADKEQKKNTKNKAKKWKSSQWFDTLTSTMLYFLLSCPIRANGP